MKLYWWTLKLEFHIIFTLSNIVLIFFQPFKNVKTIFSSWAIPKQVAGWIWPAGCSLLSLVWHNVTSALMEVDGSTKEEVNSAWNWDGVLDGGSGACQVEKLREEHSRDWKAWTKACKRKSTCQVGGISSSTIWPDRRVYEVGSEGRLGWKDRLKPGQGRPWMPTWGI